jgi:DASS family divalent anion:Na+ symporter
MDTIVSYRRMAETLAQRKEYAQAIHQLRAALNVLDQDNAMTGDFSEVPMDTARPQLPDASAREEQRADRSANRLRTTVAALRSSGLSKWFGALAGIAAGSFLWFGQPDIGLDTVATKMLGLITATLTFWVFRSLPDYGVALMFAMIIILANLESAQTVMGGFASDMVYDSRCLGPRCGNHRLRFVYRLSLHGAHVSASFYWQIIATIMGVVVMALIPQQTARTVITSQMLVNLSESLGYKTPSKASTGLFTASFLGLGQLGFLFLTGSTTSLIAWGLLPTDVREQFTWGYWFLAALPPTLVVIVIILGSSIILFRPESQPKISTTMCRRN